jgi:hypothetical protein
MFNSPPTFPEYDTKPKRHYPASFPERMQLQHQLSRTRHETKKTLSCIISGKNAIATPSFPEYDTKPKRHYPASFPKRMQLHNQLFQSTTRNQKDIILHHFRQECNCTTNFPRVRHETKKTLSCIISGKNAIATPTFQSATRNQKDIILHHFRKECNCNTNFPERDTKPKTHYVQYAFV